MGWAADWIEQTKLWARGAEGDVGRRAAEVFGEARRILQAAADLLRVGNPRLEQEQRNLLFRHSWMSLGQIPEI